MAYINFLMQGAITKRMTAIEEMAGMDVLCSDKTGTLTLNKLTVDKNLIEVINHLYPNGFDLLIPSLQDNLVLIFLHVLVLTSMVL